MVNEDFAIHVSLQRTDHCLHDVECIKHDHKSSMDLLDTFSKLEKVILDARESRLYLPNNGPVARSNERPPVMRTVAGFDPRARQHWS